MMADTGTERHIVCGRDFVHVHNRRYLDAPIILETANGIATIAEEGDVVCGGVHLKGCLLCEPASASLLAVVSP